MKILRLNHLLVILLWCSHAHAQPWQQAFTKALKNGGAYAEDESGKQLFSYRSDEAFIPASTMKLATVAAAMHYLGPDQRFYTEFYLTKDGALAVKGFGDPGLVSEELSDIAAKLAAKRKSFSGLILDAGYFSKDIVIDGAGTSNNPYDAKNGALLVNFNTVFVRKKGGTITSGEPQTPLTPIAKQFAAQASNGALRVNLGSNPETGVRYFGELLRAFYLQHGGTITGKAVLADVPEGSTLLYRHESAKTLRDLARELLKYSTNFLANQLFLLTGVRKFGPPATVRKGQDAVTAFLQTELGLKGIRVAEGAGLSRLDAITPKQMVQLLRHFEPYKELLNDELPGFRAKTGSLTGVNSYAGYTTLENGKDVRFAILVNDTVPHTYRFTLAKQLSKGLNGK